MKTKQFLGHPQNAVFNVDSKRASKTLFVGKTMQEGIAGVWNFSLSLYKYLLITA